MQGKRIEDNKYCENAGEYSKQIPKNTLDKIYWNCKTPNGHYGNLMNHTVVEHEDGTITVTPSILVSKCRKDGWKGKELWHGHLERGVWRECRG